MEKELKKLIQESLGPQSEIKDYKKLFGQASYREYFRLTFKNGQTYVVMKLPQGMESASEEVTNQGLNIKELPYLNVARYLEKNHIPHPKVLGGDPEAGFILLQDLGDRSLESLIQDSDPTLKLFFYRQAIDLMVDMQKITYENPDPDCYAFQRSFDEKLLQWELEHFLEYGIEDRMQIKVSPKERETYLSLGQKLVSEILQIPQSFTHRDFQSRNLMLYGYEFYLIDFQDALMGPYVYDLVSLLRDSYMEFSPSETEMLGIYFLIKRQKQGLEVPEESDFWRHFHLVSLQRKLKDTGRFQYIHTIKGNSSFLVHVRNSLNYVRDSLEHLPEYRELQNLLSRYLPEFGA